jgi:hypothetical protein
MAALSSIAVTNRSPKGATITFNAAAIDVTGYQFAQLAGVINKLLVECQDDMPTDTGATITGI